MNVPGLEKRKVKFYHTCQQIWAIWLWQNSISEGIGFLESVLR